MFHCCVTNQLVNLLFQKLYILLDVIFEKDLREIAHYFGCYYLQISIIIIIINIIFYNDFIQELTFVSVRENQISLEVLYLHYKSMRRVHSHIWLLWESLRDSIQWFSSKVRPSFYLGLHVEYWSLVKTFKWYAIIPAFCATSHIYTAKRGTLTTQWLDSDSVVTVVNCRQCGDYTATGSSVTVLPLYYKLWLLFNCPVNV